MYNVKLFSDFACPFCYLGFKMAEKLKEDGIEYNIEWIPYELDSTIPLEGADLYDIYPKKHIEGSMKVLTRLGHNYGIQYNNINNRFNTRRAHLAGYYAMEQGLYPEYAEAIFKAYFEDNLNLGDKEVLDKVVLDLGFDVEKMNDTIDSRFYEERLKLDYEASKDYKIESVPTFIINEKVVVTGVRDYEKFKAEFLADNIE